MSKRSNIEEIKEVSTIIPNQHHFLCHKVRMQLVMEEMRRLWDYEMVFPKTTAVTDDTLIKTDWTNYITPPTEEELKQDTTYFDRMYAQLKKLNRS